MAKPNIFELKFAALMSLITTFFVTLVVVMVNMGYNECFFFFVYVLGL